ncbi:MarR family winged helix-turn-helix transcriptional regulator [Paenibacillus sp. YIM B09110]|uniref:MarR family winged helix-turn-helix transcriptional regulator n=1 Tax=Paenibacillus sp. YIM B09110 TaxID=3126102 RepID=UPI00301D04EB
MENAIQAWLALDQLHGKLNQRIEKVLKTRYALTISEFAAISVLDKNDGAGLTIDQLSKSVNLSHSAVSRLVARLETCDTVVRRSGDADRRSTVVKLSEQGRRDYQSTLPEITQIIEEVFHEKQSKIQFSFL